jgi:hypothetical protein
VAELLDGPEMGRLFFGESPLPKIFQWESAEKNSRLVIYIRRPSYCAEPMPQIKNNYRTETLQ